LPAFLVVCVLATLQTTPPGGSGPLTAKEIAGYRLNPPAFERFDRASRLIATAVQSDALLAGNPLFTRDISLLEDVVVAAAALEGRLRSEPALAAALRTSGTTAREYTTFALALFAARLAHGFVKSGAMRFVPEGVARDNVAFVESHEAEIAAVLQLLGLEGGQAASWPMSRIRAVPLPSPATH
jgi:hypothetical protein